MFPKCLCVETLDSSLWCYWEIEESSGVRPSARKLGHWGHDLKRDIETLSPFLLLSLLLGPHEGGNFLCHTLPTMMYSAITGPKVTEPNDHGLKPLKRDLKQIFFSF